MGRNYSHNLSHNRNKLMGWGRLVPLLDRLPEPGRPSNLCSLCRAMAMRLGAFLSHRHGLRHGHQFNFQQSQPITRTVRTIRQFLLIILERWYPGLVDI